MQGFGNKADDYILLVPWFITMHFGWRRCALVPKLIILYFLIEIFIAKKLNIVFFILWSVLGALELYIALICMKTTKI